MLKRLFLALAVVLVALVAAGVAARFLVDWEAVQRDLLARVGQSVGLQISFDGDVGLKFVPRPTLRIEGVRIGPATTGEGDQTIIGAETVEVSPSLMGLLRGRIDVEAVTLTGVSVALERDAGGRGNWEALLEALGQGEGGGGGDGPAVATEIRIARGTVFFHDRVAGHEETISAIAGRINLPGELGSYQLDLAFLWRGVALSLDGMAAQPGSDGTMPFDLALRDADVGSLRLSGRADINAGRVAQGRIQVDSSDAGTLLARFGSGGALPASMRKLQFDGRFAIDGEGANLDDLRVRLGEVSASGGVVVRFGDRPRVDAALNVAQITLDPLLAMLTNEGGQEEGNAGGLPTGVDGHLALEIGAATYRGSAIRSVKLDATLANGKLAVQGFEGTAPGGTTIKVKGQVETASAPQLQGEVEVQSDDLRAFLGWLGTDLSDIASTRLRRAQVTAALTLDERRMALDRAKLDVDSSKVTGRIEIPWDEKADIGVALVIDRIDVDAYLAPANQAKQAQSKSAARGVNGSVTIGQATVEQRLLREVKIEGRWAGTQAELKSFAAEAPGAALVRGSGKVEQLGPAPRFTGRIDLTSREPGAMIRWLGLQPSRALATLQPLLVTADLTATNNSVAASNMAGSLGDVRFSGSAGVELADGRPKITADLQLPSWRVPWEAGAGPVFDAPKPVDFSWVTGFDADLRIAAGQLHALHYTLLDVRAVASIRERTIELTRLTGGAYDGWIRARGRVDASGDQVSYTATVEAGDLAIEPLLIDAAGFGEVDGKLHLAVEVRGAGRTDMELIRSADGTAKVVANDGLLRGFDLGRIAKRVAAVENITDIGKLIDAVEQGGQTRYSLIQGEVSISSGVARSDNIEMRLEGGSGKANGWVDLAASTVNMRGEVTIDEAPGRPSVGIVVRGSLEEPEREIKTGELSRYIQTRINAAAMGKPIPPPAEIEAAVPHTIELPRPPRRFRKSTAQSP